MQKVVLALMVLVVAAGASPTRLLLQAGGGGGGAVAGGGAGGAGAAPAAAPQGTQQLPQFLLPALPPQAQAQVDALRASVGGNVNSFANAATNAQQAGGDTALAVAFSDVIGAGGAVALLNTIAAATAFGRADIAPALEAAYGRAVQNQIAQGNVAQAAQAMAAALTLTGGIGPALAVVNSTSQIVDSVGCTGPLAQTLQQASQQVLPSNAAFAGRNTTFAYTIAQRPALSGCWTSVGGTEAGQLLSSIQPVTIIQGQAPAPTGAVTPEGTAVGAAAPGPEGPQSPQG